MRARTASSGFGLIVVLISALIVGILTVMVMSVYLKSVKSDLGMSGLPTDTPAPETRARLVEAHALANTVMTALTLCVQAKGQNQPCTRDEVAGRAGLNTSTFTTADGRWAVVAAELTLFAGGLSALTGRVSVSGVGGNAAGVSLTLFHTGGGLLARCDSASATPPAGPSDGQIC
jgi:hypothetical protein